MKNKLIVPINAKVYALILIAIYVTINGIFWGMSVYLQPIEGDLTRVGSLSENSFGPQIPQLPMPAELVKNYPLSEADIAVIGDSFSAPLLWQSVLVGNNYKVSTVFSRDDMLCNDIGQLLRQSGFLGKYLIIEKVERSFQAQLNKKCVAGSRYQELSLQPTLTPTLPTTQTITQAATSNNHSSPPILNSPLNYGVTWSVRALINEILLNSDILSHKDELFSFGNAKLTAMNGCRFFSNKLCTYGLFFKEDFIKKTFVGVSRVLELNKSLQQAGITAIWLVIPDKSTVYLGYGKYVKYPYKNIWNELGNYSELNAPDLGAKFSGQIARTKDFYLPNNSHLSNAGYLYLGRLILDLLGGRS